VSEEAGEVLPDDEYSPRLGPVPGEWRDGRHLRAIGAALTAREKAEDALAAAVAAARAAGDSWSAIGMVLGTSRQGAHRMFGKKGDE
jgi:hypothetical protein